jgi:subtilase family protein
MNTRLIINIPHDLQNNWWKTLEALRSDVRRFGCSDRGTIVEHLGTLGVDGLKRDRLNKASSSFLLWETARTDIDRLIHQIESKHNDPTYSTPGIGFVKYVEREPELELGHTQPDVEIGTNFTLDQHWLTEYRNKLMKVANAREDGSGIRIAVIDTGAKPNTSGVEGLFDVFNTNPIGWERSAKTPGHWIDKNGHGTAMATIINAVAPKAKIYACRAVDVRLTRLWDVITAVGAAIAVVEPHIFNLSLSIPQAYCSQCGSSALTISRAFRDCLISLASLQKSSASEPVFVAAAGNQAKSDGFFLPASYDFTLTVGAIDSSYTRADYSNWGTPPNEQQKENYVLLPGGKFDSNGNAAEFIGTGTDPNGQTKHCIGTSVATSLASGLLALYMERNWYNNQGAQWVLDDVRQNCNDASITNPTREEHGHGLFFLR